MGSLLAAVHPLGPGRLLLLLRACGAVCGLAGARPSPPASVPFQPARKESATFCPTAEAPEVTLRPAACAPVLATCRGQPPRPGTAAGRSGTGLERRSGTAPAAEVARTPPAFSQLGAGAIRASHDGRPAPLRRRRWQRRCRQPRPQHQPSRPQLWRTGHQAGGDTRAENAQRQQREQASITTSAWSMDGSSGCTWLVGMPGTRRTGSNRCRR